MNKLHVFSDQTLLKIFKHLMKNSNDFFFLLQFESFAA